MTSSFIRLRIRDLRQNEKRVPTYAVLAARRSHAMSFAQSKPAIDALRLHLGNRSGLPRRQQFAVQIAHRAEHRQRTADEAFALEGDDFDSSSSFHHCKI